LDIQVINNVKNDMEFNALQLLNLYRIIQESLQNVVKYAEADVVKIIFGEQSESFILQIIDNGKGFDSEQAKDGNGLNNMQRRCEECGGLFKIISSEMGTEINCKIKL
jgi:signal transduction histidine kinase